MSIENPQTPEKEEIVYKTAEAAANLAEGAKVWVEVIKQKNGRFMVVPRIADPLNKIKDLFAVLPTSHADVEKLEEAKQEADELFRNSKKWKEGYGQ